MATQVKSDSTIQRDVLEELKWDPAVSETDVGVELDDGVVTLGGTVDSYAKKIAAERAALRVNGVRALANDIEVKVLGGGLANDTEIASKAADILENHSAIPANRVKVKVANGQVTLTGTVDWQYQRLAAENAARHIRGVASVLNNITILQPAVSAAEIRTGIGRALERSARIDASRVSASVDGDHVTLSGLVRSWAERQDAERAAGRAKGVSRVTNRIKVQP